MNLYDTLEQIGPGARHAVPLLLDALTFERGEFCVSAARALERIEPGRPEVVPVLVASLGDENLYAREYAADLLAEIGPGAREAVPVLMESLSRDPKPSVVAAAARALDRIHPSLGVEQSLRMARAGSGNMKRMGLVALGSFKSRADRVVPVLVAATRDPDETVVQAALESLGRLGEQAGAAIPRLIEVCRSPGSGALLRVAVESIGNIGLVTPGVLRLFEEILPDVLEDGNRMVAQALEELAARSPAVLEMLLRALEKDRDSRLAAILCLEWLGPRATAAIPRLSKIAADESDQELAGDARQALRSIRYIRK
jgi:HEAT repeat protein